MFYFNYFKVFLRNTILKKLAEKISVVNFKKTLFTSCNGVTKQNKFKFGVFSDYAIERVDRPIVGRSHHGRTSKSEHYLYNWRALPGRGGENDSAENRVGFCVPMAVAAAA